jgi:aminoglycoside 6'-N-acetyltransferase I
MKLRKATKKDLKEIAILFDKEYSKPPYNEKWESRILNKKLNDYLKNAKIIVLEKDNLIKGFVIYSSFDWWDGRRGFIEEIVVDSSEQGKGFGKKILQEVEKEMKKNGIKKCSLMSVLSSKAFKFYKHLGFKEEDYVSMVKELK